MPGTLSQADLVSDLKGMLGTSHTRFTSENGSDFKRHLNTAALSLGRYQARQLKGNLTLQADVSDYDAPADFLRFIRSPWGEAERKARNCWDSNFPKVLPRVTTYEEAGAFKLQLMPAPSAAQIVDLGETYPFFYAAGHTVGTTAAETSVRPEHRDVLLIRALAAALQDLAADGVSKPVQLGPGSGAMPKNGTAGALAEKAMELFIAQVEVH